jgi:hypothetical protein
MSRPWRRIVLDVFGMSGALASTLLPECVAPRRSRSLRRESVGSWVGAVKSGTQRGFVCRRFRRAILCLLSRALLPEGVSMSGG